MSEIEREKFTMVQNFKENYPTRERTLAYSRLSHFFDKFIVV